MTANRLQILAVDDEPQLRRLLKTTLSAHQYNVTEASSARAATTLLVETAFDLVILDLGLPDRSGLDLIADIRSRSAVPIIVLSVRSDEAGKVEAFRLGADDYVTKPFGMAELVARISAALRHRLQAQGIPAIIECGALTIDLTRRLVMRNGSKVSLSPIEYGILKLLAENAGKVITHKMIFSAIWPPEKDPDVQYLRVYIRALRQKLEDDPAQPQIIRTELGVGYRFGM